MEGNVILQQKAGKPNNEVRTFSPISIPSYVGKLLESILKRGLLDFLELQTSNQHGFLNFCSTVTYMAETISDDLPLDFDDLQKVLDSVWVEGLIFKLLEIGKLLKVLSWYLSHWQTTIQVNRTFGTPFNCGLGVPWGGMLSPSLFFYLYKWYVVWSFRFWELSTICRRHLNNSFWL